MNATALAIFLVCLLPSVLAHGGENLPDPQAPAVSAAAAEAGSNAATLDQTRQQTQGESEQQIRQRTRWLITGGVAAVGVYGATTWWQDGLNGRFRSVNEGWFGQDTYTGGADKAGHVYFAYVGTRLLARGFESIGNDAARSLKLAAATALGAMTMVEVLDGFSKKQRFSKEDAIMNAVGTGFAVLFEKRPDLDRVLDFRLQYWPSNDARRLNQRDPVADHSGQTYLLVAKASGIPALRQHAQLRYFELALGYGSRGFEPHDVVPATDRARHLYFGISLNVSEILAASVFRGAPPSRTQSVTNTALEFLQVPGTAVLADHRL